MAADTCWSSCHERTRTVLVKGGVSVPLTCEMGTCGACLTPVLDSLADHRDGVQSNAEKASARQQIALCCSRSHTHRITVDL